MPNFIKIGGGQEHFGLFLVDFIWNDPIIMEMSLSYTGRHRYFVTCDPFSASVVTDISFIPPGESLFVERTVMDEGSQQRGQHAVCLQS